MSRSRATIHVCASFDLRIAEGISRGYLVRGGQANPPKISSIIRSFRKPGERTPATEKYPAQAEQFHGLPVRNGAQPEYGRYHVIPEIENRVTESRQNDRDDQ